MIKISEEEKAMYIYALHIVLYTNDIAMRPAKFLESKIKEKDKRSRTLLRAIIKRRRKYDNDLLKRIGEKDNQFYTDFNERMDELTQKNIDGLRRSAEWIFRCNGYEDTEYLSRVEELFSMICFAISIANSYISGLRANGARTFILQDYKLDEIKNVITEFYDWTMFTQHKEKRLDLSRYKSVSKYFDKIKEDILSRENFENAYSYAMEEEKKRNNKE